MDWLGGMKLIAKRPQSLLASIRTAQAPVLHPTILPLPCPCLANYEDTKAQIIDRARARKPATTPGALGQNRPGRT